MSRKEVSTAKDWESGKLGQELEFAEAVPEELEKAIDTAAALKPISIRLQENLIDKLKLIATFHGIGYQPMIRDLLHRFVRAEIRTIVQEYREAEEILKDDDSPVAKFFARS